MTTENNNAIGNLAYQQRLNLRETESRIRKDAAEQYLETGTINEDALILADKLKEAAYKIQIAQSQQSL